MQQEFRFAYASASEVQSLLESLASHACIDRRADDFFVFTAAVGAPEFSLDAEITASGILSVRSGSYFCFLGLLVEALTGSFGPVTIEDHWPAPPQPR